MVTGDGHPSRDRSSDQQAARFTATMNMAHTLALSGRHKTRIATTRRTASYIGAYTFTNNVNVRVAAHRFSIGPFHARMVTTMLTAAIMAARPRMAPAGCEATCFVQAFRSTNFPNG